MWRSSIVAAAGITACASILFLPVAKAQKDAPKGAVVSRKLLEERRDAARSIFQEEMQRLQGAEALPQRVAEWSERWLDAELALSLARADRLKALEAHVERTKQVEKMADAYAKTGQGRQADASVARYYRADAEIRLQVENIH